MTKEKIISLVLAAAFALLGFSLKWQWDTNAQIAAITVQLEQLVADGKVGRNELQGMIDAAQDDQIRRFWGLHGWARDNINSLRMLHNKEPSKWPDDSEGGIRTRGGRNPVS